jgi:tetratricopeptide (TPR) repeat protein
MGAILADLGELSDSQNKLLDALAVKENAFGSNHPEIISTLNNLALMSERRGDIECAVRYFQRVTDLSKHFFGENHQRTIDAILNGAIALRKAENFRFSLDLLDQALVSAKIVFGGIHERVADIYVEMGETLCAQQNHERERECLERALQIYGVTVSGTDARVGKSLNLLGVSSLKTLNTTQARSYFERAIEIYGEQRGQVSVGYVDASRGLVLSLAFADLWNEAYAVGDKLYMRINLDKKFATSSHQLRLVLAKVNDRRNNRPISVEGLPGEWFWEQISMFEQSAGIEIKTGDIKIAKARYLMGLCIGIAGFGPEHPKCRQIQARISALPTVEEKPQRPAKRNIFQKIFGW